MSILICPGCYDTGRKIVKRCRPKIVGAIHEEKLGLSFVGTGGLLDGDRLYMADFASVVILDISDMKNVKLLGLIPVPMSISHIQVHDSLLYIANYGSGLFIFDVSNPGKPVQVGYYGAGGYAGPIEVVGSNVYIIDGVATTTGAALEVLDTSDPFKPAVIGSIAIPCRAADMDVSGSFAYLALGMGAQPHGLMIIDISQPTAPKIMGTYTTRGYGGGIRAIGQVAYLVESWGGLLDIIDVSNPSAPVKIGEYPIGSSAGSLFVSGNTLCIPSAELKHRKMVGGTEILDISNPARPRLKCAFNGSVSGMKGSLFFGYSGEKGAGRCFFSL